MRTDWKYCPKNLDDTMVEWGTRRKKTAFIHNLRKQACSFPLTFFSDCIWKRSEAFFFFFCFIALRYKLFLLKHTDVAFTECAFFNWKKSWNKFEVKKFLCQHHIIDTPLKTPKNVGIKLRGGRGPQHLSIVKWSSELGKVIPQKVLQGVPHKTFTENLMKYGLDEQAVSWI